MDRPQDRSLERFRELYPALSEEELRTAQENFRRYVALALRIYEAICADQERYAQFKALTLRQRDVKVDERSKNTEKPK